MKVLNQDRKRVCDVTPDRKTAVIKQSKCITIIFADKDQKLHFIQKKTEEG